MLFNRSDYLKTGGKIYDVAVHYDDAYQFTNNVNPLQYFMYPIHNSVNKIKLIIKDYGTVDIDCSKESIVNNGLFIDK